ncbi:HAT dimerization [Penicillium sp. DV-2018c]|nr:HAT dimerization [Penicillium sp. DV-2018c]KAJ5576673.1 HAT dimerization [Penicillium sp. DV-2018c]
MKDKDRALLRLRLNRIESKASSHKEAFDLLDDVGNKTWKKAKAPVAPIAKLRYWESRRVSPSAEDTVSNDPEIKDLRLTPNDWKQLSDTKKILAPFHECTD